MSKIFISYRRSDSAAVAGRLFDSLTTHFGPDEIFIDSNQIQVGSDFKRHLSDAIENCEVVLVLIGPSWLGAKSAIQSEFDPIRLEIEAAIKAKKMVLPVLVDDASMPRPAELPDSLHVLSFQNALQLREGRDFRTDVARLIRVIDDSRAMKSHVQALKTGRKPIIPAADRSVTSRTPTKIFLSYRRSDSAQIAGRIFDRMQDHFGDGSVYMDIDSIPFGIDFRTHIEAALRQCKVLVVVIGSKWTGRRFFPFQSRIFDDNDPVRIEVETAFQMKVPILPVLLDKAEMPSSRQLPKKLNALCGLNAPPLDSGRDFDVHMHRLLGSLEGFLAK